MISEHLLKILVCPETKLPVALANADSLTKLNDRIRAGSLVNLAGNVVREPADALLVRNDGKRGYLVRQDIPIMLVDEGVDLESAK